MSTKIECQIKTIEIKVIEPQEILLAEKQLKESFVERFEKLKKCFPSCDVLDTKEGLHIIDELGIATTLKEVASAFGMVLTETILVNVKGKAYRIHDNSFALIELLNSDTYLLQMIESAKRGEAFTISETEKIERRIETTTGKEVSRKSLGLSGESKPYINALNHFNLALQEFNTLNKSNMINGTVAMVETRAKKMGYTVQKKQNGQQLELVLVRMQG